MNYELIHDIYDICKNTKSIQVGTSDMCMCAFEMSMEKNPSLFGVACEIPFRHVRGAGRRGGGGGGGLYHAEDGIVD